MLSHLINTDTFPLSVSVSLSIPPSLSLFVSVSLSAQVSCDSDTAGFPPGRFALSSEGPINKKEDKGLDCLVPSQTPSGGQISSQPF